MDLVITESADEVLVYDKHRHEIHHLNQTSAVIWRLCDGRRSVSSLAHEANMDMQAVQFALTKLDEANLLESPLGAGLRVSSPSRRAFLKKAAIAGAAVPVIASISAPNAAANSSCTQGAGSDCTSTGCCRGSLVCATANAAGVRLCVGASV